MIYRLKDWYKTMRGDQYWSLTELSIVFSAFNNLYGHHLLVRIAVLLSIEEAALISARATLFVCVIAFLYSVLFSNDERQPVFLRSGFIFLRNGRTVIFQRAGSRQGALHLLPNRCCNVICACWTPRVMAALRYISSVAPWWDVLRRTILTLSAYCRP